MARLFSGLSYAGFPARLDLDGSAATAAAFLASGVDFPLPGGSLPAPAFEVPAVITSTQLAGLSISRPRTARCEGGSSATSTCLGYLQTEEVAT